MSLSLGNIFEVNLYMSSIYLALKKVSAYKSSNSKLKNIFQVHVKYSVLNT